MFYLVYNQSSVCPSVSSLPLSWGMAFRKIYPLYLMCAFFLGLSAAFVKTAVIKNWILVCWKINICIIMILTDSVLKLPIMTWNTVDKLHRVAKCNVSTYHMFSFIQLSDGVFEVFQLCDPQIAHCFRLSHPHIHVTFIDDLLYYFIAPLCNVLSVDYLEIN